VTTEEAQ
jgi:hypothetical protein